MKQATLIRLEHGDKETIGVFILDGRIMCFILEDPGNENAPGISRIPEGSYICQRIFSPRFGNTFEIADVPGRDLIRFHWGNTHIDTEGCPLTGSEVGWFDNEVPPIRAVLNSKKAFRRLMANLESHDEFRLNILSIQTRRP